MRKLRMIRKDDKTDLFNTQPSTDRGYRARILAANIVAEYENATPADKVAIAAIVDELVGSAS